MESLAQKYPKYYKALPPGVAPDEVDTYAINAMFPVDDPTGAIIHARKKLLIPGVRSGGKSMLKDVIEARDTLNRYIALHGIEENTDAEPEVDSELIMGVSPVNPGFHQIGRIYKHTSNSMPVNIWAGVWVEVWTVDGRQLSRQKAEDWDWVGLPGSVGNITHYRVVPGPGQSLGDGIEQGNVGKDGWIAHGGNEMPEPLSDEDWVEVRLVGGHEWTGNYAKQAKDWVWGFGEGTVARITHYRLLRFDTGSSVVGNLDEGKRLVDDPDWFMHDGGPRPKGVAQRDKVLVRMSNGMEMVVPREAYKWCWEYRQDSPDAAPHIEAWRFA